MTRQQVVGRSHSAVGHGCKYLLGQGGMKPYRAVPWDEDQECDCSGFVMWALGLSRFQPPLWYDTTRMVADARASSAQLFESADWHEALPGDAVAWPDRVGENDKHFEGHCGIVTEINGEGPLRVVHCSAGNWSKESDAIRETDAGIFVNNRAVIVRLRGITG